MSTSTPHQYHGLEILTSCVHFASASALAFCFSRRIPPITCWRTWRNLTWSRLCVILVLLDSWIFVVFSGILATGVGFTRNPQACSIAICICISIYMISKLLIYGFLSERVYIVWSGGNHTSRLQTPVYRVCCVVLVGFIVVAIFMVIGRRTHIRDDGVCVIGLKPSVGIGLIVYDLFLNVFLTVMFLAPLLGSSHTGVKTSPKLRRVAKKTLYGATTSLICSATNITILTVLGGNELGWVCMSSCVSDVVINALVLYWISTPSTSYPRQCHIPYDRFSLPAMDLTAFTVTAIQQSPGASDNDARTIDVSGKQKADEVVLPDEMFDYIPKEHLGWRDADDDDYAEGEGENKAADEDEVRPGDSDGGPSRTGNSQLNSSSASLHSQ